MPPPGKAPVGYPQPGEPGGGALPETNPYVANMAPYGTVPIAIYPPFEKEPVYPTRCVIYSQLNDIEDLDEEYKVILNFSSFLFKDLLYIFAILILFDYIVWDSRTCIDGSRAFVV